MRIPVNCDVADSGSFDTLLVMGGDVFPSMPVSPELREAASDLAGRSGRVASICTGTFILAASGLLDGRRATTHWQHTATLARAYPQITVVPDAIFIQDGTVFSSAGVTAGIDLALALLERDHGAEMARRVAQLLVVFLQRPGGQSQFSPSLSGAAAPGARASRSGRGGGRRSGGGVLGRRTGCPGAPEPTASDEALSGRTRYDAGQIRRVDPFRLRESAPRCRPLGDRSRAIGGIRQFGIPTTSIFDASRNLAAGVPPSFSSFRLRLTFVLALRRAHALLVEPGKAVVRDLTPAVVDGQRVTSIAEDLVFVDRRGLGRTFLNELSELAFGTVRSLPPPIIRSGPRRALKSTAAGLWGAKLAECCLEQRPTRGGNRILLEQGRRDSSLDTALAKDLWNDSLLCEYAFR